MTVFYKKSHQDMEISIESVKKIIEAMNNVAIGIRENFCDLDEFPSITCTTCGSLEDVSVYSEVVDLLLCLEETLEVSGGGLCADLGVLC